MNIAESSIYSFIKVNNKENKYKQSEDNLGFKQKTKKSSPREPLKDITYLFALNQNERSQKIDVLFYLLQENNEKSRPLHTNEYFSKIINSQNSSMSFKKLKMIR